MYGKKLAMIFMLGDLDLVNPSPLSLSPPPPPPPPLLQNLYKAQKYIYVTVKLVLYRGGSCLLETIRGEIHSLKVSKIIRFCYYYKIISVIIWLVTSFTLIACNKSQAGIELKTISRKSISKKDFVGLDLL